MEANLLDRIEGKEIEEKAEVYLGRINFEEAYIGQLDIIYSGLKKLIDHRKDFITKGIQLITRYKSASIFGENERNFLNIYLIRFYIADGMILIKRQVNFHHLLRFTTK